MDVILNFPIFVFIDSQVFISEAYNFGTKGNFDYLQKHVNDKKITLITSDIVTHEVERHIEKDVSASIKKIKPEISGRGLAIFKGSPYQISLDESLMIDYALTRFRKYLSDAQFQHIEICTVDLNAVLDDYFNGSKPFGENNKKSEFPDAFNLSMLRAYSQKNNCKVYIVSGDNDFSNIDGLYQFKSLGELLDKINKQDQKLYLQLKDYLANNDINQNILGKIESYLLNVDFEIDGMDFDRRGRTGGYDYEDIEQLSATPNELTDVKIVDIDYEKHIIMCTIFCDADLEFDCSFFDEERSYWDSEDKEYAFQHYGTMRELHNITLYVTISISFENVNSVISFNIEDLEIKITNINLNQFTLQSRERTDNSYDIYE
jgi:hypothetical protein